jgi:putative ATP-dependent endonuclease of OLD family
MKVTHLMIQNFRGIKKADITFDGHSLIVGGNNVGKSTICEALDLVLGPDRLNRFPAVEEFDFYNAAYIGKDNASIPIVIQVILTELSSEAKSRCGNHLEFWHRSEHRVLDRGELDKLDEHCDPCLRLRMIAKYNQEEDEFEADTYFAYSPDADEGELTKINKTIKKIFGFLYLRALRTGTRALSLERGSLLDVILRMKEARSGLWEETLQRLHSMEPPIDQGAGELISILRDIEKRLGEYVTIDGQERPTRLYVSKLTREHLRKTLSFFLSVSSDQVPIPFQQVGTGTLNTLVLALLSFIAEIKKENVIFAMEEPEIALPPHTQRRIANYLLTKTTQCFVTTHSPYIIERFDPQQITVLKRSEAGELTGTKINLSTALKAKTYLKHVRKGLAEGMLSNGVIVSEGITESAVLQAAAQIMESSDSSLHPLDLAGVTIISADGDGNLSEFGQFFKSLGIPVFAFYDYKKRTADENRKMKEAFDYTNETDYIGMEVLLAKEIPIDHQWVLLCQYRESDIECKLGIPLQRPTDEVLREHTIKLLKGGKGEGRSAELIKICVQDELPASVKSFLDYIYAFYSRKDPEAEDLQLSDHLDDC